MFVINFAFSAWKSLIKLRYTEVALTTENTLADEIFIFKIRIHFFRHFPPRH